MASGAAFALTVAEGSVESCGSPLFTNPVMKESKLQKLLLEAKKAHHQSSATLKKITLETSAAKKLVKERKRRLAETRKAFKAARKEHRKLTALLKEAACEHEANSEKIKRLTKKSAKLNGEASSSLKPKKSKPRRVIQRPVIRTPAEVP